MLDHIKDTETKQRLTLKFIQKFKQLQSPSDIHDLNDYIECHLNYSKTSQQANKQINYAKDSQMGLKAQ